MAFLNICGFETGDTSEARAVTAGASIQSTVKRTGSYALRINVSASNDRFDIGGLSTSGAAAALSLTTGYYAFYLRFGTLPSSNQTVASVRTSGGSAIIGVKVDSSGQVTIVGTTTSPVIATLSTGIWYRVELKVVTSGTSEGKVNGGTAQTCSTNANTQGILRLGDTSAANTYDAYYDDAAISDSAYPGEGQVNILKPNANGGLTEWDATSTIWQNVDDVPPDGDTSYISVGATSILEQRQALESAATGGVAGAIGAVKAMMVARYVSGGANYSQANVGFYSGSTRDTTSSPPANTSFTLQAKIRDTDPNGGGAWTSSGLDSLEIIAGRTSGGATTATAIRVTFAAVMVWCTGEEATPPFRRSLLGVGF